MRLKGCGGRICEIYSLLLAIVFTYLSRKALNG